MDVFVIIILGLVVLHAIECVIYRKKIMNSPHGKFAGFLLTMLFGVVYLRRLKKKRD
tara:strand:+ start:1403 stop:1573 length:171 start_codon:yes stop_codon:yes gene_type:complete